MGSLADTDPTAAATVSVSASTWDRIDRRHQGTRYDVRRVLRRWRPGQDTADTDQVEVCNPGREERVIERVELRFALRRAGGRPR